MQLSGLKLDTVFESIGRLDAEHGSITLIIKIGHTFGNDLTGVPDHNVGITPASDGGGECVR